MKDISIPSLTLRECSANKNIIYASFFFLIFNDIKYLLAILIIYFNENKSKKICSQLLRVKHAYIYIYINIFLCFINKFKSNISLLINEYIYIYIFFFYKNK